MANIDTERVGALDRLDLEHTFLDHAKSFNWSAVKDLLKTNPDLVNVRPAGRWSALHQASFGGDKEMASFLLEKGADPNAETRDGKTPFAVAKGDVAIVLKPKEAEPEPKGGLPVDSAAAGELPADSVATEGAESDLPLEPPAKKAKKAKVAPDFKMNINKAVDIEFRMSSLAEIADAPVSALLGIGPKTKEMLNKFKVRTVRDLANWKFYKMARGIAALVESEEEDKRSDGAALNINLAMDKKHEPKSLNEIVNLPPSGLQGLADWVDPEFAHLGVKTIGALGEWKFAKLAERIVDLSNFETDDFASI